MTKLVLTIEASAATLATILAALPNDAIVSTGNGANPTATGAGTAVAPALPTPSAPTGPAPIPFAPPMPAATSNDDDDDADGAPSTADRDSTGLPWDERIHASTRTVTAKGAWKKRKGVGADVISQVEGELRARDSVPIPMTTIPLPTGPIGGASPQPQPVPMPMPAPVIPPMPANPDPQPAPMPVAAPAPVAQPAAAAPASVDMMGLMQKIAEKQMPAEYLQQITQEIATASGQPLNAITDLMGKQQLIDYAVALFQRDGRW